MLKNKVTIIIPVFNEKNYIDKIIKKIKKNTYFDKQIIIVDDCSTDGTKEALKKLELKKNIKVFFHDHNLGKGAAIKSGQKYVKGKYVAIQDADLEYDPNDLKKIINEMDKNNLKVMYGSRVLNKNTFQNTQNFLPQFLIKLHPS
jgi:glycosyltransferase involved in cell wall biosynthesis